MHWRLKLSAPPRHTAGKRENRDQTIPLHGNLSLSRVGGPLSRIAQAALLQNGALRRHETRKHALPPCKHRSARDFSPIWQLFSNSESEPVGDLPGGEPKHLSLFSPTDPDLCPTHARIASRSSKIKIAERISPRLGEISIGYFYGPETPGTRGRAITQRAHQPVSDPRYTSESFSTRDSSRCSVGHEIVYSQSATLPLTQDWGSHVRRGLAV